jgi:hypothetical protein
MGRLLREIMNDEDETFHTPSEEMIPELIMLGTLEHKELSLQSGKIIHMDIINYNGKNYAMKTVDGGRWFGTYDEMHSSERTVELDSVYDEVRFKH